MGLRKSLSSLIASSITLGLFGCATPMQQQISMQQQLMQTTNIFFEPNPRLVSPVNVYTTKPKPVYEGLQSGKVGVLITAQSMPAVEMRNIPVIEYDARRGIRSSSDYVEEPEIMFKDRWAKILSPVMINNNQLLESNTSLHQFAPEADNIYIIRGGSLVESLSQINNGSYHKIDQIVIDIRSQGIFDKPVTKEMLYDRSNCWINADELRKQFPRGSLATNKTSRANIILSINYAGRIRTGENTTVAQVLADAFQRPVIAPIGLVRLSEQTLYPQAVRGKQTREDNDLGVYFVTPKTHYLEGNFHLVQPMK